MNQEFEERTTTLSDDSVQEMLRLAERLRAVNGGELDDNAVQAVSEATGAPIEYVRLAVRMRSSSDKEPMSRRIRAHYLAMEPSVRRYVATGATATLIAFLMGLENFFQALENTRFHGAWSIFGILNMIAITIGVYTVCTSREPRSAAVCGAILTGFTFAMYTVVAFMLALSPVSPYYLLPLVFIGAVGGILSQRLVDRYRPQLGLKDPLKERQELLRQLVELQDKLRSGEQSVTFLSVDIVGSTSMKQAADALSVEFTFNEYHRFVESIAQKFGGRVHSTAGDGATVAFDTPQAAYSAARNLQAGMIEINTFRNKIGRPIVTRCGIHTGTVVAPDAGDITTLNYASVIDIAAHLQKVCPPGGIAVSEAAAAFIPGGAGSIGSEYVDGVGIKGVVWQPRVTVAPSNGAVPPPAPPAAPSA